MAWWKFGCYKQITHHQSLGCQNKTVSNFTIAVPGKWISCRCPQQSRTGCLIRKCVHWQTWLQLSPSASLRNGCYKCKLIQSDWSIPNSISRNNGPQNLLSKELILKTTKQSVNLHSTESSRWMPATAVFEKIHESSWTLFLLVSVFIAGHTDLILYDDPWWSEEGKVMSVAEEP